jgi:hypothetical protein
MKGRPHDITYFITVTLQCIAGLFIHTEVIGFWYFVHRPDSKQLEYKKHDVSETGSASVLM